MGHPVIIFSQWAGMMLLFILDGSQIQLLFSLLPLEYQNTTTFFLVLFIDQLLLIGLFVLTGFAENVELLVFLKCTAACENISQCLQERRLRRVIPASFLLSNLRDLKMLTVTLGLFNKAHANIIFGSKLFCMTLSVTLTFFAIRLFSKNIFVGIIYVMFAAGLSIVFCITFEKAGTIPGQIVELKKNILVLASRIPPYQMNGKAIVIKEVKSVMNMGIKVGSFRILEKTSTPVFIDFVISQVAALLVNFR